MRVTSHCANHPSKEAGQRCRSCRTWLCASCVRRYGRHVYCGRGCQLRGVAATWLEAAGRLARQPVHGAWAITISGAGAALLLTLLALGIAELVGLARGPAAPLSAARERRITARVIDSAGVRRVLVEGAPGSRVLLADGDRPLAVLTIGSDGTAEAEAAVAAPGSGRLRVELLARSAVELDLGGPEPAAAAPAGGMPGPPSAGTSEDEGAMAGPAPPLLQLVADGAPRIALTFDGDSSSNRSSELLDVLHELDLEVTIFVTGRFIDRHPAVIRRAVLSGHEVGNHTYSHPHLTTWELDHRHSLRPGVTRDRLHDELRRTEAAFRRATGRRMAPLWRAPFGEENPVLRAWALEIGYLHVRWSSLESASLDSRDWIADEHSGLYQSSSTMMQRLLRFPELSGGIVLMHLSTQRSEPPWRELPTFVDELRRRGGAPPAGVRTFEGCRLEPSADPEVHGMEALQATHARLRARMPGQ
ncbi:MAG: polysaccharide deacetylase family protein, partial [Thermoanaerobaculales bacterium]|nr:polysaccharide deacetylase family protein [Thermoanaerobaculales bacterium]